MNPDDLAPFAFLPVVFSGTAGLSHPLRSLSRKSSFLLARMQERLTENSAGADELAMIAGWRTVLTERKGQDSGELHAAKIRWQQSRFFV